jgi:hypothetical protein
MSLTLDLTPFNAELDRYSRALSASEVADVLRYVGGRVGLKAEELAGAVPPPSRKSLALFYTRTHPDGSSYKSKFKSAKQQGYVMALAARGGIPRKRTGKLPQSITSEVISADETGATVAVGTNYQGAQYVIGKETQSHYHRGNWVPLEDALVKGEDALFSTASNAFFAETQRRLGG